MEPQLPCALRVARTCTVSPKLLSRISTTVCSSGMCNKRNKIHSTHKTSWHKCELGFKEIVRHWLSGQHRTHSITTSAFKLHVPKWRGHKLYAQNLTSNHDNIFCGEQEALEGRANSQPAGGASGSWCNDIGLCLPSPCSEVIYCSPDERYDYSPASP